MRLVYVFAALGIGSFAAVSLAPEPVQACGRRSHGGPVYYQPAPAYCQPYYAPPMSYQPGVYYAPPTYYRPGSYQPKPTTTVKVGAYDDYFEPKTINVQPGTTVRWE